LSHSFDFVDRAIIKHGNKYDYSLSEYTGAKDKVKIICRIHGVFEQRAYTHLKGCGCPFCGKISSQKGQFKQEIFINNDAFNEISEIQAWILGLYASDGCVGKYGRISIAQSGEVGYKLIKYLCDIFEIDYKHIIPCKTKRKISYCISFNSTKLLKIFSEYNIIRNKTYTYSFPSTLKSNCIRDFLRGYIEGDGCVTISKNKQGYKYLNISFVGTIKFVVQCQELAPIKGNLSIKGKNTMEIRWNGKKAIEVCKWIYAKEDLYRSYKYDNYMSYVGSHIYQDFKYDKIRTDVKKMLIMGISVNEIIKEIKIPFQTIYYWKKKWGMV
jgi:hypothetical protein